MINKNRTRIKEAATTVPVGSKITVFGWLRTGRASKKMAFGELNDGSSFKSLQLVIDRSLVEIEKKDILAGTCVKATGEIVQSPGEGQSREMLVSEFEVVGPVDEAYPIQKKKTSLEFLREFPHLRGRTRTFLAVNNVRNALAFGVHSFFQDRGFSYVHTPLITSSDCEGAGEMFRLTTMDPFADNSKLSPKDDFFSKPAFMTVSGQLEGETAALGQGEIYTFGPTFRADPSETPRHVAEFWMIEPEMAFYDFDDLLELIEAFLKSITSYVKETCSDEIAFLEKSSGVDLSERLSTILDHTFARISFKEAYEKLMEVADKFEIKPSMDSDLATEHEKYLTDELFKCPVFVTDYPASFKPFYMKLNDDGETVRAVDLLSPHVGEIVGGSQREERYDVLKERAEKQGLDMETYEWYLQTRRWGTAPHSGFGLGFDRTVYYLTGMKNLRDILPYPRCKGQMY